MLERARAQAEQRVQEFERLVRLKQLEARECAAALDEITLQLYGFPELMGTLDHHASTLHTQFNVVNELRDRTKTLVDVSFEASLFLGELSAKTSTLNLQYTAQGFAKRILLVYNIIKPATIVKPLLTDQSEKMQRSLELMAATEVEAEDVGKMLMLS